MNHITDNQPKVFVEGYPTFGLLDPATSLGFKKESKIDTSDIDLTAKALDSRISFNRASKVTYSNGTGFSVAGVDTWPLETVNGVVKGRHQPENAATNWQLQMKGDVAVQYVQDTSGDLNHFLFRPESGYVPAAGLYQNCASVKNTLINFGIYNANTASWIKTSTDMKLTTAWKRTIQNFTLASAAVVRTYCARLDSSNYIYSNVQLPAGQYTISFYGMKLTNNILTGYVQAENGSLATSPIFSTDSAESRAAAYAWVATQGQKGCTLHFDDGTSLSMNFTSGAVWHQLPFSTVDWSTRFITRISYNL